MNGSESGAGQALGIDIGGTQIKGVLVDRHGVVLRRELRATADDGSGDDVGSFVRTARALADELGVDLPVGLSAPGLVRTDRRAIAWMRGRLHGLEKLDWTEALGRSRFVPVTNDAHAALLGEVWQGAARGMKDVAMLTLGTGVGGAIMADGRLLRGHIGRAGHAGHISVDPSSPLVSIADMPGALECLIGNYNIGERTGGRFVTTHALIEAFRRGDAEASGFWLGSVRALAFAVASLINVVDPEAVIIGGGIAQAGEALFGPLQAALEEIEWRPFGDPVKLLPATLGEWAGAIGAAGETIHENGCLGSLR